MSQPSQENNRNFFRIKYYYFACVDAKSIISHDRNIKKRKFLFLSVKSCFTLYAKICYLVVVLEAFLIHSVDSLIHSKEKF